MTRELRMRVGIEGRRKWLRLTEWVGKVGLMTKLGAGGKA